MRAQGLDMISSTPEERLSYCLKIILEHEGGLSLNRLDPGGATNYGISLRYLRAIGIDIDNDGNIDEDDIIALTQRNSKEIYTKYWWDKYHYELFEDIEVVSKVFDLAVNMGPVSAHKILQKACNIVLKKPLIVDGILGTKTFNAANSGNPLQLRERLKYLAKDRYIEIIAKNPAMEWAKSGWLKRAKW